MSTWDRPGPLYTAVQRSCTVAVQLYIPLYSCIYSGIPLYSCIYSGTAVHSCPDPLYSRCTASEQLYTAIYAYVRLSPRPYGDLACI